MRARLERRRLQTTVVSAAAGGNTSDGVRAVATSLFRYFAALERARALVQQHLSNSHSTALDRILTREVQHTTMAEHQTRQQHQSRQAAAAQQLSSGQHVSQTASCNTDSFAN